MSLNRQIQEQIRICGAHHKRRWRLLRRSLLRPQHLRLPNYGCDSFAVPQTLQTTDKNTSPAALEPGFFTKVLLSWDLPASQDERHNDTFLLQTSEQQVPCRFGGSGAGCEGGCHVFGLVRVRMNLLVFGPAFWQFESSSFTWGSFFREPLDKGL